MRLADGLSKGRKSILSKQCGELAVDAGDEGGAVPDEGGVKLHEAGPGTDALVGVGT